MLPFAKRIHSGDGHITRNMRLQHVNEDDSADEEIATGKFRHSFALSPRHKKTANGGHGLPASRDTGGHKKVAKNAFRLKASPPPPPIVVDHDSITPKTSHRKTISCPALTTTAAACLITDITTNTTNTNQLLPPTAVVKKEKNRRPACASCDNATNAAAAEKTIIFQDLLGDAPDLDCHICSNSLCKRKAVALVKCGHIFHQSCLEMSLQHDRTCPICHEQVADNHESSPVVTMEDQEEEDREEDASSRTYGSSARRYKWDDETTTVTRTQWAIPPPLLIPTPSAERGSITEILMSRDAEKMSFYDVATAASNLLFSATRRPSDERRRRLDNIAAGGLSVNSISTVDDVVYNDFQKAIQEGDLDKAYVHGWRYCYFCLAYSITGQNLRKVVRLLEHVVYQMDEHDRQYIIQSSPADRAAKFVLRLVEVYDRFRGCQAAELSSSSTNADHQASIFQLIHPLNEDDVRCMAESMIRKQEQLRSASTTRTRTTTTSSNNAIPTMILTVDIGYLYTQESSLGRVMTDGLLNTCDRNATNSIPHSYIGTKYGNGVYTSDNPYAYHDPRPGQVGVIVARLKGVQKECFMDEGIDNNNMLVDNDDECVSMNVIGDDPRVNMTVLRQQSCQCLPLAWFSNSVIEPGNNWAWGNYAMTEIHADLQKLIDEFFNNAQTTSVRVEKPFVPTPFSPGLRAADVARSNNLEPKENETIIYNAPSSLSLSEDEEESCPFQSFEAGNQTTLEDCCICRSTLIGPAKAVVLEGCNHPFHLECIHRAIQHSRKCPLCRVEIGEPRGTMPSGKMVVTYDETGACASFPQGCIVIRYSLPRGIQKSYHSNPGQPFHGADRTAFLPDNDIGKSLLARLKYAFQHGLTFYIAASSSTSRGSIVVWAIQHKTKLDGQGAAGFPDPAYFFKVNQELDLLGVPSADTLKATPPRSRRQRDYRDSAARRQHQHLPRAPPLPAGDLLQTVEYEAPEMLPPADVFKTIRQPVRKKKVFRLRVNGRSANNDPLCGVCFESLACERAVVELNECGHQFHTSCIHTALRQKNMCPCCEIAVNSPQGTMPSGNMIIAFDPDRALGGQVGCIVVRYLIRSGRQKAYHPFPGNAHCSVDKIVYLSGDDTGLNLLLRLRYAFSKGLTFKVSDKQSSNGRNQLLWAIPHPDENGSCLPSCIRALDRLEVPSGEELRRATI